MNKFLGRWVFYLLPSLLLFVATPTPSQADESTKTFKERKHERADTLRKDAMDRARSRLGHEFVYPGVANRYVDFWALSAQAARLGAMLDATLNQMRGAPPGYGQPAFPPGPALGLAPHAPATGYLSGIYGPEGPTAKSVRALLEYRLVVIGNPRLAVGKVEEKDDRVMADIITKDGSLVDRYSIDKQTGRWEPQ